MPVGTRVPVTQEESFDTFKVQQREDGTIRIVTHSGNRLVVTSLRNERGDNGAEWGQLYLRVEPAQEIPT